MKRRVVRASGNHERWLVSYADFITLLFAFFVMLFASSQSDQKKAREVSDSVRRALEEGKFVEWVTGHKPVQTSTQAAKEVSSAHGNGVAAVELAPALGHLEEQLRDDIAAGRIRMQLEDRGLVITLREAAFFHPGEDNIAPAAYPTIEKIAALIRSLPNPVRLEGHTDSVPIHNSRFRSNWELSAARSIAVMELVARRFEIPRARVSIAGYAETAPVEPNDTSEGRAHNRRVDIVMLNARAAFAEPAGGGRHTLPEAPQRQEP